MAFPDLLVDGYERFRKEQYAPLADRYRQFADGQSPDICIIACADSRVDPSTIFSTAPGEMFVLRNVAALVPPFQSDGSLHGVSAGIEFAVTALNVGHIVVMGHGLCGGVAACLDHNNMPDNTHFLAPWVELAAPARDAVSQELPEASPEERQRLGEYRTVEVSLSNLTLFPFIRERLEAGTLELHGAWYSVHEGHLRVRNAETGDFELVQEES